MAGDLNRATLIGRLGRDPEVRTTSGGQRVVSFSLATSETWRDKHTGERRERTQWHNVVIWHENIGKVAEQYLRKGSKCLIEGVIETREYEDRDNVKKRITEIVLRAFDAKLLLLGDKQEGGGSRSGRGDDYGSRPSSGGRSRQDDLDDDIPF